MMGILSEDDEAAASEEAENAADGDSEENTEFITEGLLTCQLDPDSGVKTYTITYAESELTGMGKGLQSSILFRTDDPGLVHMVRTGTVSTALTFRHIAAPSAPTIRRTIRFRSASTACWWIIGCRRKAG